ncbi:MAG: EFR1 family ferrodoxin [Bacteroidales bacterium]|nr:EFR1 family ferrodoxin [Bacteroidales bacterium]
MVFYFSGTGNSLYVARKIAASCNDKIISVAECFKSNKFEFTLSEGEIAGFVFPVYFYGVPSIVKDFISKLKLNNYQPGTYTFSICTCGGNAGNAMKMFRRILRKNHFHLDSGFTVLMPDNYIILFDLLTPEKKREEILKLAEPQIALASECINEHKKNCFILENGIFPCFMTFTNYPVYNYGRSTKPFHSTDACVGCGQCEKICPHGMIHLVNGAPVWDKGKCTQCLACIHRCPERAIQHGKKTYKRGRYVNPNCNF